MVVCAQLCCAEGSIISASCLSHPSPWTGRFDWQLRHLTLVQPGAGLYEDIYPKAIKFQDMQSLDLMHHQKGVRCSLQKSRDLFQIDAFYFIHFEMVWNWHTSERTAIFPRINFSSVHFQTHRHDRTPSGLFCQTLSLLEGWTAINTGCVPEIVRLHFKLFGGIDEVEARPFQKPW